MSVTSMGGEEGGRGRLSVKCGRGVRTLVRRGG